MEFPICSAQQLNEFFQSKGWGPTIPRKMTTGKGNQIDRSGQ